MTHRHSFFIRRTRLPGSGHASGATSSTVFFRSPTRACSYVPAYTEPRYGTLVPLATCRRLPQPCRPAPQRCRLPRLQSRDCAASLRRSARHRSPRDHSSSANASERHESRSRRLLHRHPLRRRWLRRRMVRSQQRGCPRRPTLWSVWDVITLSPCTSRTLRAPPACSAQGSSAVHRCTVPAPRPPAAATLAQMSASCARIVYQIL